MVGVLVVWRAVFMAGFTLSTPSPAGVSSAGGRVAGRVVVRGPVRAVAGGEKAGADKKGGRWAGPPFSCGVGGGVLLSHTLAGAVPSALAVLASGFGKEGPGVSLPL